MRLPRVVSIINMQIWPEHVLLLVNSAANLLAIVGAAIVLVALVFLYFTGAELHKRTGQGGPVPGEDRSKPLRLRVAQLQSELKTAHRSEEAIALRVSKAEADLAAVRRTDETKGSRISKLEADLAAAQTATEQKNSRITQLETNLAAARTANEKNNSRIAELEAGLNTEQTATKQKDSRIAELETNLAAVQATNEKNSSQLAQLEVELHAERAANEQKSSRLSQLEPALATAKKSAEEAKALAKKLEDNEEPRTIGPERRSRFLEAVNGMPKGKVIVSAIFFNKETHTLGEEIVSLLKRAGFEVLSPEPLNFFTTSRPSSGIRIGFKNSGATPPEAVTLEKGFTTMGWPPEVTSLVNGEGQDVVEIQVTPTK